MGNKPKSAEERVARAAEVIRLEAQAVANLERALAIRERVGTDTSRIAKTRYDLARAKWGRGERAAAIALAERAQRDYLGLGERAAIDRAKVESWLSKRVR